MQRSTLSAVLAGVAALAVISSACAANTNRATKILTPELAQKLLGGAVTANDSNKEADTENGKTWMSRAYYTKTGADPTVGLLIRHGENPDQSKKIFTSSKSMFSGVDVSGLGNAAYRTAKPAQLNVLKGANWLIISAGTFSAPDTALQEKVAKEVLPKITD